MAETLVEVQCLRPVKYNCKNYGPGNGSDTCKMDEETVKYLESLTPPAVRRLFGDANYTGEKAIGSNENTGNEDNDLLSGAARQEAIEELSQVAEVEEKLAEALIDLGFTTIKSLQSAKVEDLTPIKGVGEKTAQAIIEDAKEFEIEE